MRTVVTTPHALNTLWYRENRNVFNNCL